LYRSRIFPQYLSALIILILYSLPICSQQKTPTRGLHRADKVKAALRHIGHAAKESLVHPLTITPALGSVLCYLSGADKQISTWASTTNPIYGSRERADRISDKTREISKYSFQGVLGAKLFQNTIGNEEPLTPLLVWGASFLAKKSNASITINLKHHVGRLRPDTTNFLSFPSGHTSTTTVYTTMSYRLADSFSLPRGPKMLLQGSLISLSALTAWARVEAQRHYPSDVLAGAAIGHFIGSFFSELCIQNPTNSTDSTDPTKRGFAAYFNIKSRTYGLALSTEY